uniref:ATP synthase complex subunit 8 n=1 Tax=Sillago sihama TaxID=435225 RepID=H2ESS1_SILSI|nr:ATP synthase F0 subunit 8 [Sillago sihama]AEX31705.1 ATPase subunit 8 [Sillago sihama]
MPQLDPAPWFAIFIFSWIVFLIFLPPKVMAHSFPNDPTAQEQKKTKTPALTWPWP